MLIEEAYETVEAIDSRDYTELKKELGDLLLHILFHSNIERVMHGHGDALRKIMASIATSGHVLLEDYPGTGKTTLAKAIAGSIAGSWKRVQFTPDLLPSDITGVMVYEQGTGNFRFREGPVFTNVLIGDEINRGSPKTQSFGF